MKSCSPQQLFSALIILLLTLSFAQATFASNKIVKETITSEGKKRSYYLFVPEGVSASKPAPLIITLHGSGSNGGSLVEKWKDLAASEGIIVTGPDSSGSSRWNIPKDGPQFLYDLVEAVKAKHPVNDRRVYLFGHSAGAGFALNMAVLESKYFAAAAVHASAYVNKEYFDAAERRMPIAIYVGANDPVYPVVEVRKTRDLLIANGFTVQYTELPNHDHNYYIRAKETNASVWDFLRKHELAVAPEYTPQHFRD